MSVPLRIRGGLALPRHKPGLHRPILALPLPPVLLHPLIGHGARVLTPRVVAGERVRAGTLLADGLRASAAGTVRAIEPHPVLDPYRAQAPCVVIDTHPPPHGTVASGRIDDAVAYETLLSAGIDGQGGAGFPAAVKLRAVRRAGCRLLLINACECEPGIACDEALLQEGSEDVVAAIEALVRVLAPGRTRIAIERDKGGAIAALERALGTRADIGMLLFEPLYPSGAEAPLLARVLDHVGLPAPPAGRRPSEAGLLCLNVATALALGRALAGEPLVSRIVTVTGDDGRLDANVRVTLGTPLGWLLERIGHPVTGTTRVRIGGPLSGHESTALGAPLTASTHAVHVSSTSAAAEPPDAPPTRPCIRCGECAPVCPVALQPQLLHWHANATDLPALQRLGIDRCIECGCCDVVCPSALPLTAGFRAARRELAERARRAAEAERAEALVQRRTERLQREERRRAQAPPVAARPNVDAALARVKARARARTAARDGGDGAPGREPDGAPRHGGPDGRSG